MLSTDIINRIIELIKENPNDSDLGEKIRHLYWEIFIKQK